MDLHDILNLAGSTSDLKQKLVLARLYAALISGHSGKIYDAIFFENLLVNDFSILIADLSLPSKLATSEILHLISEPYNTGGHTRLCEKLAAMESEDSQLLITRACDKEAINRLRTFFKHIDTSLNEDELERIKDIFLKVLDYKKVVLHIHPDDILTVVAVGLAKIQSKDLIVYFVNHSDHAFSFGKSITDVMLQISYRGYEVDSLISNKPYINSFIGIPVNIRGRPILKSAIKNVVIAGSSFKMKPTSKTSIQREIFELLSVNKQVSLKVIGCNYSDFWWWKLKLFYPKRVFLFKSLPYEKYIDVIKSCDTCIDTAPITGGTAFVEMFLHSLRPIGILSGIYGYTPLDKLRIKTLSEIHVDSDVLLNEVFEDILRVHSIESVKARYLDTLIGELHPIDESLTTLTNDLELFNRSGKARLNLSNYKDITNLTVISNFKKIKMIYENFNIVEAAKRFLFKVLSKLNFKS
jgi:hypothetical protein